ncbi:hypothetical protein [Paraburkholderia fungorum]|uniref:Uncharacterized protein n=1 Tax=Paraburkholderia fungorum TaxID=134537 RepID=A0AAW3V3L4_9BURK|nr:hypothetical protein [Paraburkholderia fungorum]MBB4517306.1 hypothetical protein [Paraburkholderia fungorum]MBB6204375.1 hypothetical protein [Paraburkholderia fungorum]
MDQATDTALEKDAIAELRRREQGCLARVTSIKRKLAGGSHAVSEADLLRWENELAEVRAKLPPANESAIN